MVDCYVSLWVGNAKSDEKLLDYVSVNYDEDDDDYGYSQFMKDFCIDYLDEDFMERIFHAEKTDSLKELLSGCSYEDKVIPEFEKIFISGKKFNSAILIYDMDYDGNINKNCRFEFTGTVKINIKKEI